MKPPSFFKSGISIAYNISNAPVRKEDGFIAVSTRTRAISFGTSIVPHFSFGLSYGIQQSDGVEEEAESASFSMTYASPTSCWGVKAGWTKEFKDDTWKDGTFYLGLVVNFFKESRTFGNMASKVKL